MNRLEVNTIIYHSPCVDGFGSALAFYHYLKQNNKNIQDYTFIKGIHGVSNTFNKFDKTTNLLICDFSYNLETMEHLIKICNKVLVLDHHKSAQKVLENLPEENKIFDMNKSGCILAWEYFFEKSIKTPLLLQYIQDRDIWTNKQTFIEEFVAWFYKLPFDFEEYEKYLDDDLFITDLMKYGFSNRQIDTLLLESILSNSFVKVCMLDKPYIIAFCNSPIMKSDIGHNLLKKYPFCDFSITFDYTPDNIACSLRSDDTKTDVSEIALALGGGGHRNASAIRLTTFEPSIITILDNFGANIYSCELGNILNIKVSNNILDLESISTYFINKSDCVVIYNDNSNYISNNTFKPYVHNNIINHIKYIINRDCQYYVERAYIQIYYVDELCAFINYPVLHSDIINYVKDKYRFLDSIVIYYDNGVKHALKYDICSKEISNYDTCFKNINVFNLQRLMNSVKYENNCALINCDTKFINYLLETKDGCLQNIIVLNNYYCKNKLLGPIKNIIFSNSI